MSAALHHHISLIVDLPSPAVIGKPWLSPLVPLITRTQIFILMCTAVIPKTSCLYPPTAILAYTHPPVLAYTLPSFDTSYSPPQNLSHLSISPGTPLSSRYHVFLTILPKAERVGPSSPSLAWLSRFIGSLLPWLHGRSNNVDYCTNKIFTSSTVSENVVHRINKFIASSFAFGCHVGYHGHIFLVGLLFLSTAVPVNPCSKRVYLCYLSRTGRGGWKILPSRGFLSCCREHTDSAGPTLDATFLMGIMV